MNKNRDCHTAASVFYFALEIKKPASDWLAGKIYFSQSSFTKFAVALAG